MKRLKIDSYHIIIIMLILIICLSCENYLLFVHSACLFNGEDTKRILNINGILFDKKSLIIKHF